jgi:Secretion system C-terminal sorting domain
MKKILLLIVLYLGVIGSNVLFAQALPCNITSTGLELYDVTKTFLLPNNSLAVSTDAYVRLKIVNAGTATGSCFYAPGKVRVEVPFVPAGFNSHYYKYDDALTFTSAKYSWVYEVDNDRLVGTNTVNITAGLSSTEIVDIKIEGVKATPIPSSSVSDLTMELSIVNNTTTDNVNDNTHFLRVNVSGPGGGVLPITLNEFDAKAENCTSVIKWKTSNETNLNRYEVESSSDGIVFAAVGTVKPSASNTTGLYQFSWNQKAGKAYYRLKIIDNDASVTYSKIMPVISDCLDKKLVQLYPNPVNTAQILNVNISGYDKGIKGDLYSATGQFIKSYVLKNGKNDLTVENLSQGFYTLKISENGSQTEVFKLNVVR